ncbi:MAG: tetratricopeptide repeat protein [Chloroflexota bacterium]
MMQIALRTYYKDIESLISKGQLEEAIAHCRHVLKAYPKYVDIYRLLGKSYLEAQRYSDAADIFQRVLSSVPDDFVSHVGMSIIRQDEGNIDSAIWHMERAFEVQPSNVAIQDELRQLYGRRDGLEPPKIRLTRGALSRMYIHGNLFQQAISELRTALAEDPERPDLQVMLTQVYFESGKQVEAAEVCSNLLNKLPYCLEANRILAAILPGTERDEDAKFYANRVYALDPYSAYISETAPTSADVPDQVLTIEKLEWRPEEITPPTPTGEPEWAATLGVELETPQEEERLPSWLVKEKEEEAVPTEAAEEEVSEEELILPAEEELPSWMEKETLDVGLEAFEKLPSVLEEEGEIAEEIEQAEIPDWVQELAPPAEEIESGEELVEELPDWLREAVKDTTPSKIPETGPPPAEELPEWAEAEDITEAAISEIEEPIQAPEVEEVPAAEGLPDWLQDLGAIEAPPVEVEAPAEEIKAEPTEKLPDWLQELTGVEEITTEEVPVEEEAVEAPEELPAWLQSIEAEEVPVAEAELPEEEEEIIPSPVEALPEWLQELEEIEIPPTEEEPTTEKVEAALAEEIPEWLQEPETAKAPIVEAELPPEEEEVEVAPAMVEEIPEWLQELEAEEAPPAEAELPPEEKVKVTPAMVEEVPEWLQELEAEEAHVPAAEPPPVREGEITTTPVEEMPPWIQSLKSETPVAEIEEKKPVVGEEEPDWLRGLLVEEEIQIEAGGEAAVSEEIPEWLQGLGEERAGPKVEASPFTMSEDEIIARLPKAVEPLIPSVKAQPERVSEEVFEGEEIEQASEWLQEMEEPEIAVTQPPSVAKPGKPPFEEIPTVPETTETAETVSEWLRKLKEEEKKEKKLPTPTLPVVERKPAWQRGLEETSSEIRSSLQPFIEESQLPEWLKGLEDEAPMLAAGLTSARATGVLRTPEALKKEEQPPTTQEERPPTPSKVVSAEPKVEAEIPTQELPKEKYTPPKVEKELLRPPTVEYAPMLEEAQTALSKGQIGKATNLFAKLIRKGVYLEAVIQSLNEALYRFPVDISLWQTLGDAYMGADKLPEALGAYTKAEELIR